jgi:hypothetical protein
LGRFISRLVAAWVIPVAGQKISTRLIDRVCPILAMRTPYLGSVNEEMVRYNIL